MFGFIDCEHAYVLVHYEIYNVLYCLYKMVNSECQHCSSQRFVLLSPVSSTLSLMSRTLLCNPVRAMYAFLSMRLLPSFPSLQVSSVCPVACCLTTCTSCPVMAAQWCGSVLTVDSSLHFYNLKVTLQHTEYHKSGGMLG